MIKKIDHVVITTNNIENCISFYKKLSFNFKEINKKYELLPHRKNVQTGSADFYFRINKNIDETKKYLEQNEIQTEQGILECIEIFGKIKSIYLRCPDGNLI